MTTLLLVRHGETVDNVNRIMQGQTPGQLNEHGVEQAREAATALQERHIDAFVSSDLQRSIDTCTILAAPHGGSVAVTPLLRERDWGSFTGKHIPSLSHLDDPTLWPKDIETLPAMKERAEKFLAWIRGKYPGQTVLAVGHGIINKAVQSVYYSKPMNEILPMKNLEVRVLEL
ncbi:histidine phosphatase family protein [Prevotella dentasini]|uniref:histidine phosphatase family protein n=1 Tax=Prevotella dentasini TaxID=589537 RepID=UPI00046A70DA|nr:histidine phosphatase family protein [Prevotella dentasini]